MERYQGSSTKGIRSMLRTKYGHSRKLIAFILVLTLIVGVFPQGIVNAETKAQLLVSAAKGYTKTETGNGFAVEQKITGAWENGESVFYNVQQIIKNTGNSTIDNWALSFDLDGSIESIWNAEINSISDGTIDGKAVKHYLLKNSGSNQDIMANSSVEIGFIIKVAANADDVALPFGFKMEQGSKLIDKEAYEVFSYLYGDTTYSYNGCVVIKNLSDKKIEDWELSFAIDCDVIDFYTADIIAKGNGIYVIKNRGYNAEIKPGEQIFIGFTANGNPGANITGKVSDAVLYDVNLGGEGIVIIPTPTPVVTITPTEVVTPTAEITEVVTPTEEVTVVPTEVITPTEVATPTEEVTVIPTEVITPTEEITVIPTEIVTPTEQVTPTEEVTVVPTEIVTPTDEITEVPTEIVTVTPDPYDEFFGDYTEEELFFDEDNDNLPLYAEIIVGTDPLNPDTDGDGLSDFLEVCNGTDPLVYTEKLSSDNDTDGDGLSDCDEIYEHHTNPCMADTDNDGLSDGFEIKQGLDPLNPDSDGDGKSDGTVLFEQKVEYDTESLINYSKYVESAGESISLFGKETIVPETIGAIKKVSISTSVPGDINKQFTCDNLYGEHAILSFTPGMIGVPVSISTETEFETAILTFTYDENLLGDAKEENLRIAYYNDAEGKYEIFEDSVIDADANTISITTTHFSPYTVIDIEYYWECISRQLKKLFGNHNISERANQNTVHFCVDVGTDFFINNVDKVKDQIKRFDNVRLKDDKVALQTVCFTYKEKTDPYDYSDTENKFVLKTNSYEFAEPGNRQEIEEYIASLKTHNHVCRLSNELSAIESYLKDYPSDNSKVVLWITATTFSDSVYSEVNPKYINYFKDNNIKVYQVHIGEPLSTYKQEAIDNIAATGGHLYEINDSTGLDEQKKDIINKLTYTNTLVVLNSGAFPVGEAMDNLSDFISEIVQHDKIKKVGLLDVYEEASANTTSHSDGAAGMYYFNYIGMPYEDSSRLNYAIDRILKPERQPCSSYYEYKFVSEYFDNFSDWDDIKYKTTVMISNNIINKSSYGYYFDKAKSSGIKMYLIYVGKEPYNTGAKEETKQLFRDTGGDAFFVYDNFDKFEDAMSLIIGYVFGRTDDQDSDGDGLTDCQEIFGMCINGGDTPITTAPHDPDTDKDGLSDGYEIRPIEEGSDLSRMYSMVLDPNDPDTDKDGYIDKEDLFPTYPAIHFYAIDDYEKVYYLPIERPDDSRYIQYGGDQSWWADNPDVYTALDDEQVEQLDENGCGAIAAADLFLYMARQNSAYITTDISSYVPNFKSNQIPYSEFSNWFLNYLTRINRVFDYTEYDFLGIWGEGAEKRINEYYSRYPGLLQFEYYYLPNPVLDDYKDSDVQRRIIETLSNNIPVPFEIGLTPKELDLYNLINDPADPSKKKLEYSQSTSCHWMTITGLYIDDQTRTKYMILQSWGKLFVADFNQWLRTAVRSQIFDGIIVPCK